MKYLILITLCFCVISSAYAGKIVDNYYVFDSWEEAKEHVVEVTGGGSLYNKGSHEEIYQKLADIVDDLYPIFQKKFPGTNIPKPIIVITIKGKASAIGKYIETEHGGQSIASNVIQINSAFSYHAKPEDLYAVMAHEMSHMVKRHSDSLEVKKDDILYSYLSNGDCEACDLNFSVGETLAQDNNIKDIIKLINKSSSHYFVDTNNIPIGKMGTLTDLLGSMVADSTWLTKEKNCVKLEPLYNQLYFTIDENYNEITNYKSIKDKNFNTNLELFAKYARECFKNKEKI